jgi:hypothetical protein
VTRGGYAENAWLPVSEVTPGREPETACDDRHVCGGGGAIIRRFVAREPSPSAGIREFTVTAGSEYHLPVIDPRLEQARLWRLKAEELRTVADQIKNPMTRASFVRMAETHDNLARRCEEQTAGDIEKEPKVG